MTGEELFTMLWPGASFTNESIPVQDKYSRTAAALGKQNGGHPTIAEMRVKLEIRTWVLRASLAVNAGVVAGIVVRVLA